MIYSEKELHQALIKLSTLMTAKIIGNINPNPGDSDFMPQLRVYMHKVFTNNSKEQNDQTRIQTQLRTFLKKGKSWEKMETPIPDVSVIKVPIKKQKIAALFHSLGSRILIQYCQNCGGLMYFMSNNPVRGIFKCKCRLFEGTLPRL